jgi:transcriptional regulator with XRE-family HTH domain
MNRLKELRKEKKLYQKMVAKIFGVNVRTWRRWECGEAQIRIDKLKEIADYFGVTEAYLLGYTNNHLSDNKKKFHEFWDGKEGSAVDKLNDLTQNSKGKINVVGYQLIHGDNGYPITYILVEEDG